MKAFGWRGLAVAAVAVGMIGAATPAGAGTAPASAGATVQLVVGVRPDVNVATPEQRLTAQAGIAVRVADAHLNAALAAVHVRTVEVPAEDRAAAMAALRRDPNVRYVDVAHPVKASDLTPPGAERAAPVTAKDLARPLKAAGLTPDDPVLLDGAQPELERLKVPAAWDVTTGSPDVTVAVVDTGVTAGPDLADAMLPGWDFFNERADTTDDNRLDLDTHGLTLGVGHGTLVASILAARGDNGIERAGVCWSCKVLPVKALNANGDGTDVTVAAGIVFAADSGAKVINVSIEGPDDTATLRRAVSHATAKGALVVAAAGNNGTTAKGYPAAIPEVLAVGGAGDGDARDPDSSYGASWVDVAAPFQIIALASDGFYYWIPGTSFSSPLAAGVAALALAVHPTFDGTTLSSLVTRTARPLPGNWVTYGMVNAEAATDLVGPRITGATPAQGSRRHGTVTVTATGVSDNVGVDRASLYADGAYVGQDRTAPYAVTYDLSKRKGTVHLQWRVYDRAGNRATFDRSITADNTPPRVQITKAPKNKAKVKGKVKIVVTASDYYGVNRVELVINGKRIATDRTSPYSFTITASKQPKTMKVRIRAYDNAGNVKYAPTRTWRR